MDQVLAKFKQGQKAALKVQAEARQEREDKLAKAAAGEGVIAHSCVRRGRPLPTSLSLPCPLHNDRLKVRFMQAPTPPFVFAAKTKSKAAARPRKATSGDASASVASGGGAAATLDWKQRSRTAAQAVPLGVKIKAVVDFLRASGEPQRPAAIAAGTGL